MKKSREELKRRAECYSLDAIKLKIEGRAPISDFYGKKFLLEEGLIVRIGPYYPDLCYHNLHDFREQAVNNAINELSTQENRVAEDAFPNSRLVDIFACLPDRERSIRIMQETEDGQSDSAMGFWLSQSLFEKYARFGLEIDPFSMSGNTIMHNCAKIHPEIFKCLEKTEKERKERILEHLARAHIFEGTSPYPTCGYHGTNPNQPIFDWRDIVDLKAGCTFPHIYGKKRTLESPRYQREINSEIDRAKEIFGKQFAPICFDWENGSTLENYHIDPSLFEEFRYRVKETLPATQSILDSVSRETEKISQDSRRKALLYQEQNTHKNGTTQGTLKTLIKSLIDKLKLK